MTKEELWVENRQFYQELVEKYHLDQEPMIDLIDQLGEAEYFAKFYPSNSHEALGLSTAHDYLQRCERNMVYIIYRPVTDRFEVLYQSGQGKTRRKELYDRNEILSRFSEIETWLVSSPI
jgi:hypothetical protein